MLNVVLLTEIKKHLSTSVTPGHAVYAFTFSSSSSCTARIKVTETIWPTKTTEFDFFSIYTDFCGVYVRLFPAHLEGDFEEMESRLVYLEALCLQCEQQTAKQQHINQSENYKKKKRYDSLFFLLNEKLLY